MADTIDRACMGPFMRLLIHAWSVGRGTSRGVTPDRRAGVVVARLLDEASFVDLSRRYAMNHNQPAREVALFLADMRKAADRAEVSPALLAFLQKRDGDGEDGTDG